MVRLRLPEVRNDLEDLECIEDRVQPAPKYESPVIGDVSLVAHKPAEASAQKTRGPSQALKRMHSVPEHRVAIDVGAQR